MVTFWFATAAVKEKLYCDCHSALSIFTTRDSLLLLVLLTTKGLVLRCWLRFYSIGFNMEA